MKCSEILDLMKQQDLLLSCAPDHRGRHELMDATNVVQLVPTATALLIQQDSSTRSALVIEPGCGPSYVIGTRYSPRVFKYEVRIEYVNRPEATVSL